MQYVRHALLGVTTHCDCSIGRHLDGVCHYNMIYFNTWMQFRFHNRIHVGDDGTIRLDAVIAYKTAYEHLKIINRESVVIKTIHVV